MCEELKELKKEFSEIWSRDGLASFSNASNFGLEDLKPTLDFKYHPPAYNQELVKYDSARGSGKRIPKYEMRNIFSDAMISYNSNHDDNPEQIGVENDLFGMSDHSGSKNLSANQSSTAVPIRSHEQSIKDESSDLLGRSFHHDRMIDFMDHNSRSPYLDNFHFDEYEENSLSQMWGESTSALPRHDEFPHSFDFERSNAQRDEALFNGEFMRPRNRGFKPVNEMTKYLESPEVTSNSRDDEASNSTLNKDSNKSGKSAFTRVSVKKEEGLGESPFHQVSIEKSKIPKAKMISSFNDDEDDSKNGKKETNGLRIISRRVVEIINQRGETSFVDVADILVDDMKSRARFVKNTSLAKEEKNLKRRVYDALNVLIASNVIEKNKKRVILKERQHGIAQLTRYHNESAQILDKIKQVKERRKQKLEKLQELISKNLAVRNIIERNRRAALKSASSSQSSSQTLAEEPSGASKKTQTSQSKHSKLKSEESAFVPSQSERLSFPLLVLNLTKDAEANLKSPESVQFVPSEDRSELLITSNRCFQVLGDIDILLKMNMQKASKDFFLKHFKKELLNYLPKNYFRQSV